MAVKKNTKAVSTKTVKAVKTSKTAAKPILTSKKSAAVKPADKKSAKKSAPVAARPGTRSLTAELVSKIKQAIKKGATQSAVAAKTKLPRSTIYNIAVGNTWKDVK